MSIWTDSVFELQITPIFGYTMENNGSLNLNTLSETCYYAVFEKGVKVNCNAHNNGNIGKLLIIKILFKSKWELVSFNFQNFMRLLRQLSSGVASQNRAVRSVRGSWHKQAVTWETVYVSLFVKDLNLGFIWRIIIANVYPELCTQTICTKSFVAKQRYNYSLSYRTAVIATQYLKIVNYNFSN